MNSESGSAQKKYTLRIKESAEKEWRKLPDTIRTAFRKKLEERLINPRVEKDKLSGMKDCYKIKLKDAGYRLVYRVDDGELVIEIIAAGKRERNEAYISARKRL
ncbi:mRNA interferase toxin RelE [compost metagenome]